MLILLFHISMLNRSAAAFLSVLTRHSFACLLPFSPAAWQPIRPLPRNVITSPPRKAARHLFPSWRNTCTAHHTHTQNIICGLVGLNNTVLRGIFFFFFFLDFLSIDCRRVLASGIIATWHSVTECATFSCANRNKKEPKNKME